MVLHSICVGVFRTLHTAVLPVLLSMNRLRCSAILWTVTPWRKRATTVLPYAFRMSRDLQEYYFPKNRRKRSKNITTNAPNKDLRPSKSKKAKKQCRIFRLSCAIPTYWNGWRTTLLHTTKHFAPKSRISCKKQWSYVPTGFSPLSCWKKYCPFVPIGVWQEKLKTKARRQKNSLTNWKRYLKSILWRRKAKMIKRATANFSSCAAQAHTVKCSTANSRTTIPISVSLSWSICGSRVLMYRRLRLCI